MPLPWPSWIKTSMAASASRAAPETVLLPFSDPCLIVQPPSVWSHLGDEPVSHQSSQSTELFETATSLQERGSPQWNI